jgi:hypothetical protein
MAAWQAMPPTFCQRFFCLLFPFPIPRFGQIGEIDDRSPLFLEHPRKKNHGPPTG